MGKTLDDLFEQLSQMSGRMEERFGAIEQRLDRIEERLDRIEERLDRVEVRLDRVEVQLDLHETRFEQLEQRMERQESLMKLVEEMGAELIQKVASTNDRLDNLYQEARGIREEQIDKKLHLDFLDKKVWQHEKDIYLLRERVAKYEKES